MGTAGLAVARKVTREKGLRMGLLLQRAKVILSRKAKLGYRRIQYMVPSRVGFHMRRPVLGEPQARILEDLNRSGIAFVSFRELFTEDGMWQCLVEGMNRFVGGEPVQRAIRSACESGPERARHVQKDYIVRLYEECAAPPSISVEDCWLRIGVDRRILDVVNSYLGLWSKLQYLDRWYTVPVKREGRVNSQNWHRDPEDKRMLKVFLFFSEVDEAAGPFQYIPGSSQFKGTKYSHLWPTSQRNRDYPPSTELERVIPSSEWITCTCPPGTLVFCDTTGFHRGGFATARERALAVWMYTSALSGRHFRAVGNGHLRGAAHFALS